MATTAEVLATSIGAGGGAQGGGAAEGRGREGALQHRQEGEGRLRAWAGRGMSAAKGVSGHGCGGGPGRRRQGKKRRGDFFFLRFAYLGRPSDRTV